MPPSLRTKFFPSKVLTDSPRVADPTFPASQWCQEYARTRVFDNKRPTSGGPVTNGVPPTPEGRETRVMLLMRTATDQPSSESTTARHPRRVPGYGQRTVATAPSERCARATAPATRHVHLRRPRSCPCLLD